MRWFVAAFPLLFLSGCVLPTPVSIATLGFDAVSYALSGKTVVDHGVSMVMNRDCALVGLLEGRVCAEEREFQVAAAGTALAPLPNSLEAAAAAGADPEVLAAAERGSRNWDGTLGATQFASLTGGYLSDGAEPFGFTPRQETAQAAPLAPPKPQASQEPHEDQVFAGTQFLADAALVPVEAAGLSPAEPAQIASLNPQEIISAAAPPELDSVISPIAVADSSSLSNVDRSKNTNRTAQLARIAQSERGAPPDVPVFASASTRPASAISLAERLRPARWTETGG